MVRVLATILVFLSALPAFCQSGAKYQVATITAVEPHREGNNALSDRPSYDVSVRVDSTVYVVRYTPPLGLDTVEYAGGRDLLVLVGEKTIKYNDILGRSFEVPIVSRKPVTPAKKSK
jgi:hypothetical protein